MLPRLTVDFAVPWDVGPSPHSNSKAQPSSGGGKGDGAILRKAIDRAVFIASCVFQEESNVLGHRQCY